MLNFVERYTMSSDLFLTMVSFTYVAGILEFFVLFLNLTSLNCSTYVANN